MFDKISSKSLKRVLVLKYIVQLLGVPFVMGGGMLIILFTITTLKGVDYAVDNFFYEYFKLGNLYIPLWLFTILSFGAVVIPTNILSILPFCKLILDCIMQDSEITTEMELSNELPAYELLSFRNSKKFLCDTFSRKRNVELFIYDENKTKYRIFWNESYGSYEKAEQIICDGKRLKISYFKRSKIIFRCELIE
ncbi:MAG: hypothetical protein PUJ49_06140 [bacterium]|nr:hypothetical protein [bacterium]